MIKIEFTCKTCGVVEVISVDDIDGKEIVPVCEVCYNRFLAQKGILVRVFKKRVENIYEEYGIPVDTFNVSDEYAGFR